ncbi:MAG: hypothetical protein ACM4D3_18470 [Candidatus Sericytochromatia bacterium]
MTVTDTVTAPVVSSGSDTVRLIPDDRPDGPAATPTGTVETPPSPSLTVTSKVSSTPVGASVAAPCPAV